MHALLDSLGAPRPLVGHSIGGRHLRAFAARWPDEVARILLIDSPHEAFDARRDALLSPVERTERESPLREMRRTVTEGERLEYEGMDATPPSEWDRPLPPVPLIVLSASRHGWQPERSAAGQEAAWQELQRALARLSSLGEYRIVDAGHNIQQERPEVVVSAVRDLVATASRSGATGRGRDPR